MLIFTAAVATGWCQTVTENIFFLKPDGLNYLNYRTTRSSHPTYRLYLKKDEDPERDYHYIYPNVYEFDTDSDPNRNVIVFPQGSHATMRPGNFREKVTRDKSGVLNFVNWDEERDKKSADDHFGEWTTPDNFAQYVYAWVLPDNLEILSYECNHGDEENWRWRGNTLAWFGADVNDLVFKISYQTKTTKEAEALKSRIETARVAVSAGERSVKVVLPNEVLFDSGSADLSEEGKRALENLSQSFLSNVEQRIVVEGHTDNEPISGALLEKYGSNWELSAARSIAVLRFLQSVGIGGERLETRAHGEFRPTADNGTVEGRALNRRIEIQILQGT